jgi:hypothetical protein
MSANESNEIKCFQRSRIASLFLEDLYMESDQTPLLNGLGSFNSKLRDTIILQE